MVEEMSGMHHGKRRILAALVGMALSFPMRAPAAEAGAAIREIAQQLDRYPLVMIGEWHRSAQQHEFLRAMLRDPVFLCRVDDIVVEFGNARLQRIADDYVSGKSVSEADVQSMWRETEVMFAWNSPVYRQFYETVREVNQKHVCAHPVRLVLADPPIDWSRVKTLEDFQPFADRDGFFADVVEREVLAKKHRALLIAGALHVLRKLPPPESDEARDTTVVQLIDRKHPGQLFALALVPTAAAAATLKMDSPPSFRVVRGSGFEDTDFGIVAPAWTATPVVVNGKHEWSSIPPGAGRAWPTSSTASSISAAIRPSGFLRRRSTSSPSIRRRCAIAPRSSRRSTGRISCRCSMI